MHGRLKVRTSAELEAINKQKDQEKAKVYKSKMQIILDKRKRQQYDEEMLSVTADVLTMNPDLSTVWNIRKETLLEIKQNIGEVKSVVDAELKLTEAGLRINPKSYCAWHHRCWLLDNFAPEPNWERELQVCTRYLELDERNFHCWDYRKYVVERHSTPLEKELEYSVQKLMANFSNYSAWHYRSKLIPRIYCAFEREKLFENDIYKKEVSLVENAVYTDPNDQSAWFYHRWLLGHISSPVKIVQAGINEQKSFAWVAIQPSAPNITVTSSGIGEWRYLKDDKSSNILIKNIKEVAELHDVIVNNSEKNELLDSTTLSVENSVVSEPANFKPTLSPIEKEYLHEQLRSYKQLAKLEPDNKWALLAINLIKEKIGEEVDISVMEKLKSIDGLRKNYYSDFISRLLIERKLEAVTNWQGTFTATNMSLTSFHHCYYFTHFEEIDLSDNQLDNKIFSKLETLFSCKVLKLSNCKLTSLDSFPVMASLQVLDVSSNEIQCNQVPANLLICENLQQINLLGNTVDSSVCDTLLKKLPNLKIII